MVQKNLAIEYAVRPGVPGVGVRTDINMITVTTRRHQNLVSIYT